MKLRPFSEMRMFGICNIFLFHVSVMHLVLTVSIFLSLLEYEHGQRCQDNDSVTDETQIVRNLPQENKSQRSGKDDLRIIVDGDIPCRCIGVCRRDGKLSSAGRQSRQKQAAQLVKTHGMKIKNQVWQCHQTGKGREKENDKRSLYAVGPENPHISIGDTGAQTAQKSDEGRQRCRKHSQSRLDNKKTADKCRDHAGRRERMNLFL